MFYTLIKHGLMNQSESAQGPIYINNKYIYIYICIFFLLKKNLICKEKRTIYINI